MTDPIRGWDLRARTRRGLLRDLLKVALVASIFLLLALAVESRYVHEFFDIDHWRGVFGRGDHVGGPVEGMVIFVAVGAALVSVGVPRLLVAALGGGIYGAWGGAVLSLIAALIGAVLVYFIGHRYLREVVDRRIGGRLERWRRKFREQAFWWVLYGRLFPFTNSTVNSLLCGSCDVPLRPYVAASLLGFIPHSVIFALFGSGGAQANLIEIIVAVVLLLLSLVAQNMLHRVFPVKRETEPKSVP